MRWEQTEYLLKGIYLGLLVMVALFEPAWWQLAIVGGCMVGGLALALVAAAIQKMREGYRPRGRPFGFFLFLLLENPGMVYTGIILGLALGAYIPFKEHPEAWPTYAVAGGAILGVVFYLLRTVADKKRRMWLGLALTAGVSGAALYILRERPDIISGERGQMLGAILLLGIPGFYLLTFASMVEESEVEIAAICAALGAGLVFLSSIQDAASPYLGPLGLALPIAIYFLYTRRILPGLKVFKHTLRGLSYAKVGHYRAALRSLNRALQLDPNYRLAQHQLWDLHRQMDIDKLKNDPETLALVNYHLCLERVAWLLLQDKPGPQQIKEAQRLLELVSSQKPALEAPCAYWRAVAFLHERNYDEAARNLEAMLREPDQDTPQRRGVLFQAWQLAILLHPEMNKRVATPVLAQPGRRMEAIAAVERQLLKKADDQAAWDLKRLLYSPLTENDYDAAAPPGSAALDFDHGYAQQLGLALLEDGQRWQRGCEYLRMAARGMPPQAPSVYILIAKTHDKHGDQAGLWGNYQQAIQVARKVGVANMSDEDRKVLYEVVKQLGEHKMEQGDINAALDAFKFYSQNERAGVETYRTLAELFERKAGRADNEKDKLDSIWLALHCVEHGLSYQGTGTDKDLLGRKDRYYYSITPADLKARWEQVNKWFDVEYCLEKARVALEKYNGDLDVLDWGHHLADLATTAAPAQIGAKVLRARFRRVKGEIQEAVALLEEVRQNKPEKFASEAEEEAWHLAHRILGDIYLDEKPDQAVLCFQVYRNSQRAGADTMYKLGRAYENLGDHVRAARCYEHVTAFEEHPLYYEAREALNRVRGVNPVR